MDRVTQKPRGTAFVCFKMRESADACLEAYETSMKALPAINLAEEKKGHQTSVIQPELPLHSPYSHAFLMRGRVLRVSLALSRNGLDQAHDVRSQARREDKRSLYLLREGVIFPDSEAAKSITQHELDKRLTSYTSRKRLLEKNPNLFMSKTRLSVRNLPVWLDEKNLRATARDCVKKFWTDVAAGTRKSLDKDIIEDELKEFVIPPSERKTIKFKQVQ